MIPVKVVGLVELPNQDGRTVFLREIGNTERILPIVIGPAEAYAIRLELDDVAFQRPLSHDLIANIVDAFDGELQQVTIIKLEESTFYAELTITAHDGSTYVIDARPSDSIILALKTHTEIFVSEGVMDQAGIVQDPDASEAILLGTDGSDSLPVAPDPAEIRIAVEEFTASISPGAGADDALSALQRDMQAAIAGEDYERAATIRDQIRSMESPRPADTTIGDTGDA